MSTRTTHGTSFGADGICGADDRRRKAEADATSDAARLAALPPQVRQWSDRLDLADLDALAVVARRYRDEGLAPCRVSIADLAVRLKTDARDAEARLERCIRSGAIERTKRIAASPVFRPVARHSHLPTVTVTSKTDAPLAQPGSLLGLRRRA